MSTVRNRWHQKNTKAQMSEKKLADKVAIARQNVINVAWYVQQGTATEAELQAAKDKLSKAEAEYNELFEEV